MNLTKKRMKTLGIIGGIGPGTTAKFYLEVIYAWQKQISSGRPPILIDSIPISYFAEEMEIKNGVYIDEMLPLLIASAKKLAKSGADFLAVPCNSAHTFISEIQNAVDIPVKNIIAECISFLKESNILQATILSSLITRNNHLYHSNSKIGFHVVSDEDQSVINQIILNLTNGSCLDSSRMQLANIVKKIHTKNILIACGELEQIIPRINNYSFHSAMQIYIDSIIKEFNSSYIL